MQIINNIRIGGEGKRIGYIDAMRGFSMILVVFGHVLLKMGLPTDSTILGSILLTFRMPLFFFVSGFFSFKVMEKWTFRLSKSILKRKIQAQIISTIVFYSLFQMCHSESPMLFLQDGFSWFWFTIVLFQMYIIYMLLAFSEKLLKRNVLVTPGLLLLSILSFIIFVKGVNITNQIWKVLSWYYLAEYFQFFAFGILARKYYLRFVQLLESNVFRTIVIISYIILLFAVYGFDKALNIYNSTIYNILSMIVVRYAGLFTIFILFYNNQNYFSSDDKPCRWLRYVGRRTLDIYMLHVFILPNLLFLKAFLSTDGMLLLQLTIGVIGAILDIAVCLFMSIIIRSSSTLSIWLFGEKKQAKVTQATLIP